MESSVSTSDALVRPWRTATIVATLIAFVELFILIGFAVALFGQPLLDWAQGATDRTATPAAKKRAPAAVEQRVQPPRASADRRPVW